MNYHDYEIPENLIFETRDIVDMGGLNCSSLLPLAEFSDILPEPGKFKKAEIKLKFSVLSKEILVQGEVSGVMTLQCSRCLEMFEAPFREEFSQLYPTKEEIIDIMYITKQTMALLSGIQNICSESCKGLCGFCGCNKNEVNCGCKPRNLNQFACLKDNFTKE